MNKGKSTCNQLKAIRRQIADENGIELEIPECQYKGECSGTCPRCESEVQYLENELRKQGKWGKVLATAGIVASLSMATACKESRQVQGDVRPMEAPTESEDGHKPLQGDVRPVRKTDTHSYNQENSPADNLVKVQGIVPKPEYVAEDFVVEDNQ